MRAAHRSFAWLAVAALSAVAIVWLYPRVFDLVDRSLEIDRATAEAIALERLAELGDPVEDPYVVVSFTFDGLLERHMQLLIEERGREEVRGSHLADDLVAWMVTVYEPGARSNRWRYRAEIALDGEVRSLMERVPEEEGGASPSEPEAKALADAYLDRHAIDRSGFEPEPIFRLDQTGDRRDLTVRFRFDDSLVDVVPHGVDVVFAGDRIAGFQRWNDDPEREAMAVNVRSLTLAGNAALFASFGVLLAVAFPFLRRYHDGQLGVRRGTQIFALLAGMGLLGLLVAAPGLSEGSNFGNLTRRQNTLIMAGMVFIFGFLIPALTAAMVWPLGEWWARSRLPDKLTAFDALFRGQWANATVARASVRGFGAGLALVALSMALLLALRRFDAWPISVSAISPLTASPLPGLAWFGIVVGGVVPSMLFAYFLLPSWLEARWGRFGLLAAVPFAALFGVLPTFSAVPFWVAALLSTVVGIGLLLVFRCGDLLSMLLAGATVSLASSLLPTLFAPHAWFQANAWGALLLLLLPLIVSFRFLGTEEKLSYHWDDVPPHVRRIAERERQRVELETARGIQQSILPDLPPQLHGIEIAHTYLPATEVGGDFYDVLALDDGRLAVAVGDVAGHGVSSGLVMSMAKSALAVQVTFDPAVESVIGTLNRMVYQSARARLLTTLCYALIDPARREILYSSAGHLFPYRVTRAGDVLPLEAGAYPLGVRGEAHAKIRTCRFEPGDTLFLYSDGLVEACPEGSEEPFGFERLEASLQKAAGKPPGAVRDDVLATFEAYTGSHPREDDLTVLVLRMPSTL